MALSTTEVATELETDPRTLRKFLRATTPKDSQPGKGSRYSFEKKDLRGLRTRFAKWTAEKAAEDATE